MSINTDIAKGRVKEATGVLTGNDELRRKGKTDQAVGNVRKAANKAVDKVAKKNARLGREDRMLGTILLIILVLVLIGALPTWPHSMKWGFYPSGGVGLILLIVLVLILLDRI
jgi:uncharacterized protein YjbJ (UPF0337 family)